MLGWFAAATAALAISDSGYASLRQNAEEVRNLGRFLESWFGDCNPNDPSYGACNARAEDFQKDHRGKTLRIEFQDASEQIAFGNWDAKRGAFLLLFTPFFSERGLALSVGKPTALDKDGSPIVKNIPIWVKAPKGGEGDFGFRRQLERGNVAIELVFKISKTWAMKKGQEELRGVSIELVGLRVSSGRGDGVLAEQVYR